MRCDVCMLIAPWDATVADEACRCVGGPAMCISAYDYDYIVCDGNCTSPDDHADNCPVIA